MNKYGAKMVYDLGIGDNDKENIIEYLIKWKKDIWPALTKEFGTGGNIEIKPAEVDVDIDNLDDTHKPFPFEAIISETLEEQSFKDHEQKDHYQFKVNKFLSFDTLRLSKKNH